MLAPASAFAADVVVKGVRLEDSARQGLERAYGAPVKPGEYWYDAVSGGRYWVLANGIGMIGEGGGRGAVFVDGKVIMTPN